MVKNILQQYHDLNHEIADIRKRIYNLEIQIERIERDGIVIDTVKGGDGGVQHFKVSGFPYPEYSHKKTKLYLNKAQLESAEFELTEMLYEVEGCIQTVPDSRMRRILRLRYVDKMTWVKVALNMGGDTTDESVRKEHERFLVK